MRSLVRFCVFGMYATAVLAQAQSPIPRRPVVVWMSTPPSVDAVHSDAKFAIKLRGVISPGWHIYALEEPPGGPLETVIGIAEADDADLLHVDQGQPESVLDAAFGQRTQLFRSEAVFTLQLKRKQQLARQAATLHVSIRYQSCNDRVCLPPHTDVLPVPLPATR